MKQKGRLPWVMHNSNSLPPNVNMQRKQPLSAVLCIYDIYMCEIYAHMHSNNIFII